MRDDLRWIFLWGGLATLIAGAGFFTLLALREPDATESPTSASSSASRSQPSSQFRHQNFGNYSLWWDEIPASLRRAGLATGTETNIHPDDYAGPEACKNCHKKQYAGWSEHPHRWMNSLVENITVLGDFNDQQISYLGGQVTFYKLVDKGAEQYRMRLQRGQILREYLVDQTIGSRHFQYYVGRQLVGPEAADHPVYAEAHVLPLGYWIDHKEWVPAVHIGPEIREAERPDPFAVRAPYTGDIGEYSDQALDLYRSQCNFCHTTFPLGDLFVRFPRTVGRHIPTEVHVSLVDYVQQARPEFWPAGRTASDMSEADFANLLREFHRMDAGQYAVTLGISCEACHLGAKEHAQGKQKRPKFFPTGDEMVIRPQSAEWDLGRTHDNVNWSCGRCHAGNRPQYANGVATWNSTEYTDAMRGSCYSQLTCIRCHNPHEAIGHEWPQTPAQDDAICLSCHQKYQPDDARQRHTHHSLDQAGSRCMNCHMPHINEGLQEVVRTHTIFSPTNRTMIESNQMNACNQCHVEQPIDWTLTHLKNWYGKTFSDRAINENYPNRKQPTAINWLSSDNESVRLVAADSLSRVNARWALPQLIQGLDDPFLLNRQFARIGLERMLKLKLSDFGYQFYQSKDERTVPLRRLKEQLLPATAEADVSPSVVD